MVCDIKDGCEYLDKLEAPRSFCPAVKESAATLSSSEQSRLERGVGLLAVIALGLGTAVGISLFSIMAPAASVAGSSVLPAMGLAAVPFIPIAISYAFMGSALPLTGASYHWPSRFIHPFAGFIITWLGVARTVAAIHILGVVLVRYLDLPAWFPSQLFMPMVFTVVLVINLAGIGMAANVQTLLLGILIAILSLFLVVAYPHVRWSNLPLLSHMDWSSALKALPLLIGMYFGIEASTEFGEEVEGVRRNIPISIGISIVSAATLYLCVTAVVLGILGVGALAHSTAPLSDAAGIALGPWGKYLIAIGAVIATGKSVNVGFMLMVRSFFAMGRDGVLPRTLGYVHPVAGKPTVAIWTAFILCVAGLLLPSRLTFLFLAANIPALLKHLATCICAVRLIHSEPALYEAALFKPRGIKHWVVAGVLISSATILLGLGTDWLPYVGLGVWGFVGAISYLIQRRLNSVA